MSENQIGDGSGKSTKHKKTGLSKNYWKALFYSSPTRPGLVDLVEFGRIN